MSSKYGPKQPELLKEWVHLSDQDRSRLALNGPRFAQLTEEERELVEASSIFTISTRSIDASYYTDDAVDQIMEYYDWGPVKMRVMDRIDDAKAAGVPLESLSDWQLYARLGSVRRSASAGDGIEAHEQGSPVHQLVKPSSQQLRLENPWQWLHGFVSQKTCDECELAVDDLREDVASLLCHGRAPRSAERWFRWKCFLVYREILWTAFKGAFALGTLIGKAWARLF